MFAIAKYLSVAAVVITLPACASSGFVSSWTAPNATPLDFGGSKVAAIVMMNNDASRRVAEDSLAREITARGAQGVAMYTLMPGGKPADEESARYVLEKAGVAGAVVMRPMGVEKEVSADSVMYTTPTHRGLWGGYYGHGWSSAWGPMTTGGELRTDTIVVVETLIYSIKQNQLVWGGQSRTTNPKNVDQLVRKLSTDAAKELEKQGLIRDISSS
jgi:hypothetical protein